MNKSKKLITLKDWLTQVKDGLKQHRDEFEMLADFLPEQLLSTTYRSRFKEVDGLEKDDLIEITVSLKKRKEEMED